jgi:peptidylprolyl isomerase/peptidyl-prolyl cis-trans isomerase D
MAVLGKIRSQGAILILVIALALFAFIIQGALTSTGKSQDDAIGTVGGREINREAFMRQVENVQQQRGPNGTTVQAVNTVWDQEVRNAVLAGQIEAAGIEVTDERVAEMIKDAYRNNPQFTNEDGTFSEGRFKAFVENFEKENPVLWNNYVEQTALRAQQEQFFNLLKSGVVGTNLEGETEYRLANDKRTFKFVQLPYSSIADSAVEVSKSDIKNYMQKHEDKYQSEAQRDIVYALFKDEASSEDKAELRRKLELRKSTDDSNFNVNTNQKETIKSLADADDKQNYVNRFSDVPYNEDFILIDQLSQAAQIAGGDLEIGTVFGPYEDTGFMKLSLVEDRKTIMDSVKNRHILVAYQGAQRSTATRSKDEAKKLADSIFDIIGQSKSDFDTQFEYFKENTEVAKGEDLGWVVYSGNARGFAEGFRNFLYAKDEGTIGIAESTFGYHIIRIDETADPKDMVQLATIANKISSSKATGKKLFTQAVKFQKAATDGDFEELAKEYEVKTTPVKSLKAMDETLPGLKSNRSIVKWAFNPENEVGDIERFETSEGYIVVKLTDSKEAGMMSVEQASATVTPILRKEKKAELLKAKIEGTDLQSIASENATSVRTATNVDRKNPTLPGAPSEPRVIGTAFGLEINDVSKPIVGEEGVYIIQLTGIENAPDLQNYKSNANQIANRTANQATSKLVEALKESIEIEDNRSVFY